MAPRHRYALVVEDDVSLALRLKGDLRRLGFDICDLATDGEQAFWFALGAQPDLVVVDVCLEGGREGIEIARRLRQVCDAPTIFVTGYTDQTTIERIHDRLPRAPVVAKPVYRDQLTEAVSEATRPHH